MTSTPFDSAASPAYSYPGDYGSPAPRPSITALQKDSATAPVSVPSLTSSGSSGTEGSSITAPLHTPSSAGQMQKHGWFSHLQEQYLEGLAGQEGMPKKFDLSTMIPPPEVLPPSNATELELERLLMGTPGPLFSVGSPPRPPMAHPAHQLMTPLSHPSSLPVTPETRRVSLQAPAPISELDLAPRRAITNPLPPTPQSTSRRASPGLTIAIPPPNKAGGFLPTPAHAYDSYDTARTPSPSPAPASASPAGAQVVVAPPTPDPSPARKTKPLPKRKPSTGVGIADASNLRRGSFSREGAWTRRRSSKATAAPPVVARQGSIQGQFHLGPTPMPHPHPDFINQFQPGPSNMPPRRPSMPPQHMQVPVAGIERSLLFAPMVNHEAPAPPLPTFAISEAPPPLPSAPLPVTTSAALMSQDHHGVMLGPDDYHLLSEMDPLSLAPHQIPASAPAWQQSFAPHQLTHSGVPEHRPVSVSYGDFAVPPAPLGRPLPPQVQESAPYANLLAAPYMEQTRSAPMPQRQYSAVDYHAGVPMMPAAAIPAPQSQMMHRRRGSSVDSAILGHPQSLAYPAPVEPLSAQQVFESIQMGQEMGIGQHFANAPANQLLPPLPIYHPDMVKSAPAHIQPLPPVPMSYPVGPSSPSVAGRQIVPLPSHSPTATANRRALGLAPPPLVPRGSNQRRRATAGPGVPTLSSFPTRSVSSTHHLSPTSAQFPPQQLPSPGPSSIVHRTVSTPSRLAAAKSATAKAGGRVSQGPGNSMFINFTSRDSKKLLKGVAPSGSSKRKREAEDDLALEQARKDAGAKDDKRRVVTA